MILQFHLGCLFRPLTSLWCFVYSSSLSTPILVFCVLHRRNLTRETAMDVLKIESVVVEALFGITLILVLKLSRHLIEMVNSFFSLKFIIITTPKHNSNIFWVSNQIYQVQLKLYITLLLPT